MNQTNWNASIIGACLTGGVVCGPQHPVIPSPVFAKLSEDTNQYDAGEFVALVYNPALRAFNMNPTEHYAEDDVLRWLNSGSMVRVDLREFVEHAKLPPHLRLSFKDADAKDESKSLESLWGADFSIVSVVDSITNIKASKAFSLLINDFDNLSINDRLALYIINRRKRGNQLKLDNRLSEDEIKFLVSIEWDKLKAEIKQALQGKVVEWEKINEYNE